jgi:hypothetical protein
LVSNNSVGARSIEERDSSVGDSTYEGRSIGARSTLVDSNSGAYNNIEFSLPDWLLPPVKVSPRVKMVLLMLVAQ